jgi:hypothetical protein
LLLVNVSARLGISTPAHPTLNAQLAITPVNHAPKLQNLAYFALTCHLEASLEPLVYAIQVSTMVVYQPAYVQYPFKK